MYNNLTPILLALIALIAAVATFLIKRYALPWLQENRLTEAAMVAVHFAEVMIGRGHGEEKFLAALDYLKDRGFDIDSEAVVAAVKAAWYGLNINQIAVGMKEPDVLPDEEPEETEEEVSEE